MSDITIETIKDLSEEQQKATLHLVELFKGEENTINEYFKNI